MKNFVKTGILPDESGYFGKFGGNYLPDEWKDEFKTITDAFLKARDDDGFNTELWQLLKNYVGRPSPVFHAKNISKEYGAEVYIKREDLNHTGSHKINNALGEALLAKKMGKTKLIAETGAGSHGVAVATAAAIIGLRCDIYMGEVDIGKQKPNVDKMKVLGANVVAVRNGTKTLKEAVDEAFRAYSKERKSAFYAFGTAAGPHPFPMMVEHFQSIIGKEAREQFMEQTGKLPNHVIACVGGGSNAIGIFDGFLDDKSVNLYGVEALGRGPQIGGNSASITYGKGGVLHGYKCMFLQDKDGATVDAYSIASGLDYPGVGPKHCYLHEIGRVKYDVIGDDDAVDAFYELSRTEGIIPAVESAHAVAYAKKLAAKKSGESILVNLSGRGDKDVDFVLSLGERKK